MGYTTYMSYSFFLCLREYVEMFLSEKDLIVKSSEHAVKDYAAYLSKMKEALDNVCTCKYMEYDENVRQAAKRIGEGLEKTISELI